MMRSPDRESPDRPNRSRILVIRAGALGDTLMATPVITALARRHPGARIDFLASEGAAPLVAGHRQLGDVLTLRQRNVPYAISLEKRRLVRQLQRNRYDLAVVLEHAPTYYELAERGRAQAVSGFRTTPFDPSLHSMANNLRAAGFAEWRRESLEMLVAPPDDAAQEAAVALTRAAPGPLVGLHMGYGPSHRKRNQEQRLRGWAVENFVVVARWLAASGATIVLTGAREDRPGVDRLAALLPPERVLDVAGRTSIPTLVALLARLRLLVSVDSGPAHIAAALGTPLVVLWGPGILEQTRPISTKGPVAVVREPVACAPCYGTPLMKTCQRNVCMERITPERVLEAIRNVAGGLLADAPLRAVAR